MNNAINIGSNPAAPAKASLRAVAPADAATGFENLIGAPAQPGQSPRHLGSAQAPAAAPGALQAAPKPSEAETALSADLASLLEKLTDLTEKLKDGESLDETDLDEIQSLLGAVETLIDQGTPLPAPGTSGFALLADAAEALGIKVEGDAASPTRPLDMLSALGAQLADGLREQSPELAAKLTEFTKTLDSHAAAIQSALPDEKAGAINPRHIESETKLNPAAAIAQAPAAPDDAPDPASAESEPAKPGESERSLAGPQATDASGRADRPAGDKPAQPANAAAASTAPTPPEVDAPDGLVIQSGQPAAQANPAGAARPEAAIYQRPDAQLNTPFIAAEISRHVQNGINRFEIRLNPAELGRIDVRMEMDTSGNVVARLAVERSETLDLLQRDQRTLERALADAGLDSAKTELEFSLQQDTDKGTSEGENEQFQNRVSVTAGIESSTTPTNADLSPYMRGYARLDAVNLWV